MIGQTVSHYRITGQLGAGGMGIVYAAEDFRLGRAVALKFVPEDLARDRTAVERLRSEARTASGLNHASICTIYDIDEHDGQPFIVMELLHGQTLRERLAAGPLKIHDVVDLGIQVADALDSAHNRGVIHRDIKPANLFLVDRGPVKILDFGLAKMALGQPFAATTAGTKDLTIEGFTLGTVAYMSPEQVTGETLDGRTDLFSLGVVLYECLTGHQPFTGKTSAVIFSAILTRAPVAPVVFNPDLPLRLQEVVNNCLEKDRELRYADAAGLRADLKRFKRDIESGHSGITRLAGASSPAGEGASSGGGTRPSPAGSGPAQTAGSDSGAAARSPRALTAAAVAGAVALAVALAMTSPWRAARQPPASNPAPGVSSEATVQSRVAIASTSLTARDYRAALAQADEVLREAPDHADATRIRDAARMMIGRFDESIAAARARLASGDAEAAGAAIDAARSIDPSAPDVADLSARLVALLKDQAETARQDARRSRSASTAPNAPAPRPPAAQPVPPVAPARQAGNETPFVAPPLPTVAAPPPVTVAPVDAAPPPAPARPSPPPEPLPASQPVAPAAALPSERREAAVPPATTRQTDEAEIRRVIDAYARAIETKDLALFRAVKPNLSAAEQRRIEEGFRAVASQQVDITVVSIDHRGSEASVTLRRRDTIQDGGRQQTSESQQTMILARAGSGWVIREIGR